MAKSARASVRKRNNATLRKKIFGPAHDARTERLSAKLQELAAEPKPEQDRIMMVDTGTAGADEEGDSSKLKDTEMANSSIQHNPRKRQNSGRIERKSGRRKPKNQIVFPTSAAKRKRIAQGRKKAV